MAPVAQPCQHLITAGESAASWMQIREMQIARSEQRTQQLECEIEQMKKGGMEIEQETEQIEKDLALLDWIHSEIDLIEADLPSSSTPPPAIAARSSGLGPKHDQP